MSNLQTVFGTDIAFTRYLPYAAKRPDGEIALLDRDYPSILRGFLSPSIQLPGNGTHYGYVQNGAVDLYWREAHFRIPERFYFAIPGEAELRMAAGTTGLAVTRLEHIGFFHIGKVEERGRLRYINGCTDSLLVPPVRRGDPCLNLLYFPPGVDQTMHTHPTVRIGTVLSGRGVCVTEDASGTQHTELEPGLLFAIHPGGRHKFFTEGESMRVLAYHPDTDFGPTDEDHPMINRTMVDGVSAKDIPEIHTA